MTFLDWFTETWQRFQNHNHQYAIRASLYELYLGAWRYINHQYQYGQPIYDEDWDVLVILDACRYDQMNAVISEYEFLTENRPFYSLASASEEWMEKNFGPTYSEEMSETIYVTGNPFSREYFSDDDFLVLDEVWRYAWDDEQGTIMPHVLTERAIDFYRSHEPERMIVHYMQPHRPFVKRPDLDSGLEFEFSDENNRDKSIWDQLRRGDLTRAEVNQAYIENLRYVLDDVERLLKNINAETVVLSSDHGNLLGEQFLYDHPIKVPHPLLRKVPFCTVTARNTAGHEPKTKEELSTGTESEVSERLESLGYL
ncbi:sulfatase-like hydrolase/transferase [Halomicrococcus sp. SG-WS-1]|uniref:sulfatase-like hydrolase/transferase n=1 Tax=Halomicrococcus sp. SG-WS-1 TaxID=3439057 RepID=UPI003F78E4BA